MLCLNHFLLPHRISLFPTRGYSEKPSESASKLARSQNYKEEIAAVDSSWWRGLPTAAKKKNKTKRKERGNLESLLHFKKKKKKMCWMLPAHAHRPNFLLFTIPLGGSKPPGPLLPFVQRSASLRLHRGSPGTFAALDPPRVSLARIRSYLKNS